MKSHMTTVRISLDPTDVEYEDVEDFLATDDLFVEYFNAFLALPTFPAPLCFNKETGGFEVVTDAKKELAKQIKAAIRSQKRTPKIYHAVKNHSYAPIPLIPIEEPEGPENVEINTSFTVTTLNKEQGIHWIKEERLPAFLESKFYMEYRLGKLISQARVVGEKGDYVLMTIDYKPKSKIRRKKSIHEEPVVDPKEQMMKNMYVCMGNTSTTEADAWFTHAQISHNTETTYSVLNRPKSAEISRRPNSARPVSAYSTVDTYKRPGSGVATSIRSSVYSGYYSKTSQESEEDVYSSKLFAVDGKPMIHKPSESIFAVTEDFTSKHSRPFSGTIYTGPKIDPIEVDDESGLDVTDTDSNASKDRQDDFLDEDVSVKGEGSVSRKASMDSIVFKNIDDIGAVVVRAVLARSLSVLTNREEKDILQDREIIKTWPDTVYKDITVECFDKISLLEECEPEMPEEEKELVDKKEEKSEDTGKKKDDESDADSLLDSDDDYEESDAFFRKNKQKTYSLTKRSGVEQFKSFLDGTAGERNWHLWLDIDRLRWMSNQDDRSKDAHTKNVQIQQYLNYLREQFYKPGAHYELSVEQKTELGLSEPSSWTVEKLTQIQNKVAEPLVLYWAPRFILKQMQKSEPERNHLYHNLRQMKSSDGAYPSPTTASLLPLRPKSCMPRIKQSPINLEPPSIKPPLFSHSLPATSPPVGQRRTYAPSSLLACSGSLKARQEQKRKKLLSTEFTVNKETKPRIKSAPSRSSANGSPRPASARPVSARTTTPAGSHKSAQNVSRPSSAGSDSSDKGSDASSVFFGGRRMESLLKALHYEREAGGFFQKYVERSGNKLWINCLGFWKSVQQYHLLFYAEVIDSYVADKKARSIHAQYIVVGGPKNIGCSHETRSEIYKRLDPPFEELFDDAEEYALSVLYLAWVQMVSVDMKTYGKIELIEVKRHLETRSKYVLNLQKRGLIKERVLTPEDPMEGYEDPVYDETLMEKIPEEFREYTLEKLVHNRIEVDNFKQFLAENYASMDLLCWMDIEHFRRMPQNDEKKRDEKAKDIKTKYLNKKYFFGPNSPAGKEGQDKVMAAGGGYGKLLEDRPPNPIILEAQKYVRDRLEKKWLPLFLATPEFAERQKPKAGMDDVVDDVMVQKKKKSQAVWKMLESKWVSSSKDIITFRKALLNPVTSLQFQRYVSIQGDNLENDVLFWLEIQKFKDLYHTHTEDSLITKKVQSIIACFIESTIPPSLQIDIHPEMAEKIVDRKFERSPYIFREAQLTVFKVLFSHWNDFINFRSNLADEKVLPTIERRRRHAKMKERLKMREMEEKAQKPVVSTGKRDKKGYKRYVKKFEAERRAALGLPPEGEDDDNFHDPFGLGHTQSQDDEEEIGHSGDKNKISWSYSTYMSALQTEDILNNTDESTFNSLMSDTASLRESEVGDKESVTVTVTDKQSDSTAKKEVKSEHTQTDNKKKSVRMSPSEETISPEPIKGALKKKGREGSAKKQTVEFSKTADVEMERSSSRSVSIKVKN